MSHDFSDFSQSLVCSFLFLPYKQESKSLIKPRSCLDGRVSLCGGMTDKIVGLQSLGTYPSSNPRCLYMWAQGQRRTPSVMVSHCPPSLVETESLTNHRGRLVASKPQRSLCLLLPTALGLQASVQLCQDFSVDVQNLNSSPHAYTQWAIS